MPNTPIVSLVMPVRHGGPYLQQAINSVLAQTLRHFELLIVADLPDDSTRAVLAQQTDPRIRLLHNTGQPGIASALNYGIQQARGQYIARMDADDISLPTRLEKQTQWLAQTGHDLCGSWIRCRGTHWPYGKVFRYPSQPQDITFSLLYGTALAHPTIMAKTDVMLRHPYSKDHAHAQDYQLWTRMALDGIQMGNVPEVLLHYRLHPKQVSHTQQHIQQQLATQIADGYAQQFLTTELYPISAHHQHGRGYSYSLAQFQELANAIITLAQQNQVTPTVVAHSLGTLAYRLTPLSIHNISLLINVCAQHGLALPPSILTKLSLQNILHIKRGSSLYNSAKWLT